MRAFIACTLRKCIYNEVKGDEMGRTCGTNAAKEECIKEVQDVGG
jgi:hypothetical protein